jgi:dihydroflavonol-4-reductase
LESRIPFPPPGILSCVDVRDVAEAVARAIDHGRPGRRYLLSGANLSWQAFYQRLARLTGRPAPLAPLPERTGRWLRWLPELGREEPIGIGAKLSREELDLACLNWSVDWSRAMAELGWRPRDLQETLQDTVSDLTGGRWWVGG